MGHRDTPLSRRLHSVVEGVRRRGERFAAALSHTFSRENMAALFSARSFKEGGISAMRCVLILGIAAGSVALVEALPSTYTAIDISRDQTTSISGDTAEHLSELDCDVEVYLVAEEGSEGEYVERMLDQYAQASDRVTVEQVDPALHPTFTDQYTSEDVADGSIIVVVDDASCVVSSSDLYTLNYSTFSYEFAGESAITSAIIALTSEDLPVVYLLFPLAHGISEIDSYRSTLDIQSLLVTSSSAYVKTDIENSDTLAQEDGVLKLMRLNGDNTVTVFLPDGGEKTVTCDEEGLQQVRQLVGASVPFMAAR